MIPEETIAEAKQSLRGTTSLDGVFIEEMAARQPNSLGGSLGVPLNRSIRVLP